MKRDTASASRTASIVSCCVKLPLGVAYFERVALDTDTLSTMSSSLIFKNLSQNCYGWELAPSPGYDPRGDQHEGVNQYDVIEMNDDDFVITIRWPKQMTTPLANQFQFHVAYTYRHTIL